MNDDQEGMALRQEAASFSETYWASCEIDSVLAITRQELSRQHFVAMAPVPEQAENEPAPCTVLPEFDPEMARSGDELPFILWMQRVANIIGYRHFHVLSCADETASKTVSSWPDYLLKRLDEHGFAEQVFNELKAGEPNARGQLLSDMTCFKGDVWNRPELNELLQTCGLLDALAYCVESEKRKDKDLLVLFGDSLNPANAGNVARDISPALAKIADWYFVIQDCNNCVNNTRYKISKRERECIRWSAEGKTSYEMSLILGLSENTVNNYIATAGRKLGAVNRAHMISIALKSGIID